MTEKRKVMLEFIRGKTEKYLFVKGSINKAEEWSRIVLQSSNSKFME